jgi:hypothetical protein
VPARVTAVIYFRVVDPYKSVVEVENFVQATSQISQTSCWRGSNHSVMGSLISFEPRGVLRTLWHRETKIFGPAKPLLLRAAIASPCNRPRSCHNDGACD